jgi:hypothetical protein
MGKKLQFEPLEPRILLSADLLTDGVAGAMSAGIDQFGSVVNDFILTDTLLDTRLPLVVLSGGDNLLNDFRRAPTIRELLSADADLNSDNDASDSGETDLYNAAYDSDSDFVLTFNELFDRKFISDLTGFLDSPYDHDGKNEITSDDLVSFLNDANRHNSGTSASSTDYPVRSYNLTVDSAVDISTGIRPRTWGSPLRPPSMWTRPCPSPCSSVS